MKETNRREFLKGTAWMGVAAMAAGCSSNPFKFFGPSGAPMQGFALKPMKKVRVACVGVGSRPLPGPDRPAAEVAAGQRQARAPEDVRRSRELEARLRDGRRGRGVQRHALAPARADRVVRHGARQGRAERSARLPLDRRVLEAGGDERAHADALHDARELLLRRIRDGDVQHGQAGRVRGDRPRRGRLHPRPARPAVRQPLPLARRTSRRREGRASRLGARLLLEAFRQLVPDARPRARGEVHGHQPRRQLRLPRVARFQAGQLPLLRTRAIQRLAQGLQGEDGRHEPVYHPHEARSLD